MHNYQLTIHNAQLFEKSIYITKSAKPIFDDCTFCIEL